MDTPRITRKQIHIVSRHSKWEAKGIRDTFEDEGIYADRSAWAKFSDIALLALGVGFLAAGIIFFFAYNWHMLHKFVKLGIAQGLVIALTCGALFARVQPLYRNILLTAASVMVGLMFSIFGQIYQTGADAYDFFLGWTVFILLWAIISDFAPLYLLLMVLINTTVVFYFGQLGPQWHATTIALILFGIDVFALVLSQALPRWGLIATVPAWLVKLLALAAAITITWGITTGIFDTNGEDGPKTLWAAFLSLAVIYAGGVYYSFYLKKIYYISIMAVSVLVILSVAILHNVKDDSGAVYLFTGLIIVGLITALINGLLTLNKRWHAND